MKLTILQVFKDQWSTFPPVTKADLHGKTVVVTGANTGLGFEAAKHFARMNPGKLILACRSAVRGGAALKRLKDETGCETAEMRVLDLAEFSSVKAFARGFEQGSRLDILVENAGILPTPEYEETVDGWETCFQINHLSTSLLALLLLPRMIETAEKYKTRPRIVMVNSDIHYWTTLPKDLFDAPNPLKLYGSEEKYTEARYGETKIMNLSFTRALNARMKNESVVINAAHPGYCYSGIRANYAGVKAIFDWFMEKLLARTSEEGSRHIIWAAVGGKEDEDKLRGAYISMSEVREPSDEVNCEEGKEVENKLWNNLIDELSKVDSGVQDTIEKYLTWPTKKPLSDSRS